MDNKIYQIAERIKGLRQSMEFTPEEMAAACGVTAAEYTEAENGGSDFSFTFLYKCANKFGIDIAELISGETPKLSHYTVVRNNKGLPIERRKGFVYQHLGYLFKNRKAEPFKVYAKYSEKEQVMPVKLSTHEGQELDYVLKGKMKFCFEDHTEILGEGDTVYYDSSYGHGMVATGGADCEFLAVVFKKTGEK